MKKHIPLSNPDVSDLEKKMVLDVLDGSQLSLGPLLTHFEAILARYVGTSYAIAVNSGTSGLHCCIKSLGIGPGDEVITTPFSFIATSNCILFENATPVFVDIDPDTYNINTPNIEEKITSKTKAILPVHVFGVPSNMPEITRIASKYNLKVIEDAAEALGSEHNGVRAGSMGDCGVFAFYPNKQITTGEGGVIVTNNDEIANLCRSYRNQGRGENGEWLQHERLGYNYRLSDLNCALGIAQMQRIEEILEKRNRVAHWYLKELEDVEEIKIQKTPPYCSKSWFVFVVQLTSRFSQNQRDTILESLRRCGISCSNYFGPIHLQPFMKNEFGYQTGDFPVTEFVGARTIALPFYNNLQKEDVLYITNKLKELLRTL